MVSRCNQASDSDIKTGKHLKQNKACANYFQVCLEEDTFLDASLLDPIDGNQHEAIRVAASSILKTAQDNGLSETDTLYLRQAFADFMDVFWVSFSAGPPAIITPL